MVIVGAVLVGACLAVLFATFGRDAVEERPGQLAYSEEMPTSREMETDRPIAERIVDLAGSTVGTRLKRFTPEGLIDNTERKLFEAGLSSKWSIERVLALKLMGAAGALVVGAVVIGPVLGGALVPALLMAFAGFVAPDAIINRRADERQGRLQRELPDLIDQISVSVEAGLGFEQSLMRTADSARGELGVELRRVVRDIQLGMSRSQALDALVDRTGLDDIGRFVRAVRVAERQGLAMAATLANQAEEIRDRLQLRAEEKAMQIPVKLTFPLVLFILPALFLVILGPAFLDIAEGL